MNNIFTYVLTNGQIILTSNDGITSVDIKLISGAGFIQGTKNLGSLNSAPINLSVNELLTIVNSKVIDNLTIDCTAGGVIQIIAKN